MSETHPHPMANPEKIELSVVLPCLNEKKTLVQAIGFAQELIAQSGRTGEIVVADNGSTDGSIEIAQAHGARVVDVKNKGYGYALLTGIRAAQGDIIVMGDADATYDFREAKPMVDAVADGADLVIGDRLHGNIEPGAMPFLHRYLGTPVLSWLIRHFFKINIHDCNCGMRAFSKTAFEKMKIVSGGMEFASEMLIKASYAGLRVEEVKCSLMKDTRDRAPHLKTWSDGWRHLRFIMLFAPHVVFRAPGWTITVLFGMMTLLLSLGPITIAGKLFDYHHLFYSIPMLCMGVQLLWFSEFADRFRRFAGLDPRPQPKENRFPLEQNLILGSLLLLLGFCVFCAVFIKWWLAGRGDLLAVRSSSIALALLFIGMLTVMNATMISMLELHFDTKQSD